MLLGRDEVGDHGLVGGAADRAEDPHPGHQRESEQELVPREEEQRDVEHLPAPADQDQPPPTVVVGEMASQVAGARGKYSADQEGGAELAAACVEHAGRPDPEEDEERRPGDRAGQGDGEDGPQRAVDLTAPHEAEQAREDPHPSTLAGGSTCA